MKYVLVTGAASGMGQATAIALKNAGYTVMALDKQPMLPIPGIVSIVADIKNIDSLHQAFEQVRSITESLYAIVHFAGVYALDSLVEIDEDAFTGIFDVNVFGAYRINKIFLPLLTSGSRILITTSELAPLDPLPFTGLYAITKSALDKYAYSLRMELQLLGICVCVLQPGAVKTDMLQVSTDALDRFCAQTKLYSCNARRFKGIVERVEARNVSGEAVAKKTVRILAKKQPRYTYHLNRNPLLLMLNILPHSLQTWIIGRVLK